MENSLFLPLQQPAELLKNTPIYSTDSNAELTTPTGAAIISTLSNEFGEMPEINIDNVSYGAGEKNLDHPNVLRLFMGRIDNNESKNKDPIDVIETNIDDMNPEIYEYVIEKLMKQGALDAYIQNILMKKNRPGTKLTVLSNPDLTSKLANIIFEETTSIGLRIRKHNRITLDREIKEIDTKYGKIKVKISKLNGKIMNKTPEYEDCKKAAEKNKVPLKEIYKEIKL